MQSGSQERAFARLYKFYPKVEKYIQINSGSKEEALDIFQEALIVLFKKVQNLSSDSSISIDGFLINSCKLLWSNELRKKKVRQNSGEDGLEKLEYHDEIDVQIEKESKLKAIDEILKKLGEKCKSILEAFYYKSLSMDKIANKFGYKTVQSAKVQKYKCMEHARKLASSVEMYENDAVSRTADMKPKTVQP
mgnify:CR=1 FL=1